MHTPKLIAMYEKRIDNLEKITKLQAELIRHQQEKITYLEEYCGLCNLHIDSLKRQLDEDIDPGTEMASDPHNDTNE